LTALTYHYETQPLPTPLAWWLHQAPRWFHKFSTLFTLTVELAVPLLYFAPAPLRLAAAGLTVLLQLLILLTGNFAFFNLLTIGLVVFLLDEALLQRVLPGSAAQILPPEANGSEWGPLLLIPLAALIVLAGGLQIWMRVTRRRFSSRLLNSLLQFVAVLRIVNPYGLFAVMTTVRPEIRLEGSDDEETWLPYEFKYKPGNPRRPPPIVAPHQPRLDWQMWFAALGSYPEQPWFVRLVERLAQGSPEVLRLLAKNPFPDRPPRYLRAVLYDYRFTTPVERAQSGDWWKREPLGLYLPPVTFTPAPEKETAP
jgi:hypothetical protein